MKYISILFIVLSLFSFGCDRNAGEGNSMNDEPILPSIEEQGSIVDYQSISIDYGLSMFQDVVSTEDENVLISPFSLQSALYMTMHGAKDETLEEFRTALNVGDFYPNGLANFYRDIGNELMPNGLNTNFNSQNKIYYYPTFFTPDDEYVNEIEEYYAGSFEEQNFSDPSTVDIINGWVSEVTEGRIEKVLDQISADEAIFLINALVFTADWSLGFEPSATSLRSFRKSDATEIEVPTMSSDETRPYYKGEGFSAVDFPVKDEDYAVTFIVANEESDINSFVNNLDINQYNRIYDLLQLERVKVYLPKFKLATSMDVKDVLIDRGMVNAFESANLSGMGDFAGNEYLTRVLHDVFIKVDEKGIEGAAVTTVGVGVESLPPSLFFDKPFVFVVRHVETRIPIFIGKVGNPLE